MADLSTLFIGPDGRGRDFRVRAEAPAHGLAAAPGELVRSLPLVLAKWAEAGERDLVAGVRLATGDVLVLRAGNSGRFESGFGCYCNAVIVPAAWATAADLDYAAIVAVLPPPGASDRFARQPLPVESIAPVTAVAHDWGGLGARWNRRCVVTDGVTPPEAVLGSILASLRTDSDPAFTGWATSVTWATLYGPEGDIRLVVVAPDQATQVPGDYDIARMTRAGFDGVRFDLPLPARIRNRFIAQLQPQAQARAAALIAAWPADKPGSLTEQLFEVAGQVIAPLDYEVGLAQTLRFATIPASEFDGFFAALSRRLFRWFLERDRHRDRLGPSLAFMDQPAAQSASTAIGPLAGYVLDSETLCRRVDNATFQLLAARHDLVTTLMARRDLGTILTWLQPAVAVSAFDALLSVRDLNEDTARGLTQAAATLFSRTDTGAFAALLQRHLAPASLIKTGLLIDLVMLIYDSDLPRKARHG